MGHTDKYDGPEAEERASKILGALYSGLLSPDLEESIRAWYFSPGGREEKEKALCGLFDSIVKEASETGISTIESLDALKSKLNLPKISYPSQDGKVKVPADIPARRRGRERISLKLKNLSTSRRKLAIGIAAIVLPAALIVTAAAIFTGEKTASPLYTTMQLVLERPAETAAEEIAAETRQASVPPAPEPAFQPGEEITAIGTRETIELADGSSVRLYPGGRVVISRNFGRERELFLAGKAFFDIAEGEGPFSVLTDGPTITVYGTEFMATSQERYLAVTLYEGSLDVCAEDVSTSLAPGDRLEYFHSSGAVNVDKVPIDDPDNIRHDLENMPMNAIFDMVEQCYGVNIVRNDYNNTAKYSAKLPESGNVQIVMEMLRGLSGDFDYIQIQNSIFLIPKTTE